MAILSNADWASQHTEADDPYSATANDNGNPGEGTHPYTAKPAAAERNRASGNTGDSIADGGGDSSPGNEQPGFCDGASGDVQPERTAK